MYVLIAQNHPCDSCMEKSLSWHIEVMLCHYEEASPYLSDINSCYYDLSRTTLFIFQSLVGKSLISVTLPIFMLWTRIKNNLLIIHVWKFMINVETVSLISCVRVTMDLIRNLQRLIGKQTTLLLSLSLDFNYRIECSTY